MSAVLSSLWLSVESAEAASSVIAGMVSVVTRLAVEVEVAWVSWEIRGWEIWVRWEGDCQNSDLVRWSAETVNGLMAEGLVRTILIMLEGVTEHAHGC